MNRLKCLKHIKVLKKFQKSFKNPYTDWNNQGRKWYKNNDPNIPYVYIKRTGFEYVIIVVNVDELNTNNTLKDVSKDIGNLRRESTMKRSWKDKKI